MRTFFFSFNCLRFTFRGKKSTRLFSPDRNGYFFCSTKKIGMNSGNNLQNRQKCLALNKSSDQF